jgi:hypothetical protein
MDQHQLDYEGRPEPVSPRPRAAIISVLCGIVAVIVVVGGLAWLKGSDAAKAARAGFGIAAAIHLGAMLCIAFPFSTVSMWAAIAARGAWRRDPLVVLIAQLLAILQAAFWAYVLIVIGLGMK